MNKKELRALIGTRAKELSDVYKKEASEAIAGKVLSSPLFLRSESVFVYMSMKNEPQTQSLIDAALKAGKRVFVPKCVDENRMKAVRIRADSEFFKGSYGIREPKQTDECAGADEIELAIVPCVSASRDCRRLGHGAGYYDLFLSQCNAFKMCLCFEKLLSDEIETDEHDVYMDLVVTEKGIYAKNG